MEKSKPIGALWIKTAKSGMQYMSGVIKIGGVEQKIVCFQNSRKKDNQPDYSILESKDRENSQGYNQAALSAAEGTGEVNVEDIPF